LSSKCIICDQLRAYQLNSETLTYCTTFFQYTSDVFTAQWKHL